MAEESPKHQSWWQTLPGILTAVAGIITAATGLIVALSQAGVFRGKEKTDPSTPTPITNSSPGPSTRPAGDGVTSVDELEQKLKDVNIMLSTGTSADRERVYGYLAGPEPEYRSLALGCLQVVGNRRMKKAGYLDMIDKHYTSLASGSNYLSADGKVDLERVRVAMVKAQIDLHGGDAKSFEKIVESR